MAEPGTVAAEHVGDAANVRHAGSGPGRLGWKAGGASHGVSICRVAGGLLASPHQSGCADNGNPGLRGCRRWDPMRPLPACEWAVTSDQDGR